MERFDIIGSLHTAAQSNEWQFAAGDNFAQNLELLNDAVELLPNTYVFTTTSFRITPTFANGRVVGVRYDGIVLLGRKTDMDGEQASLDETYMQKYERRLFELISMLTNFLGNFACNNELTIDSFALDSEINKFDTNIDFVGGQIAFSE